MNFGRASSNFFRGNTMKNMFNSKTSFKFTSFNSFQTKNFVNFSNSYFLLNVKNLMNITKTASPIQISKLVLGSTKNATGETEEVSLSQVDLIGMSLSPNNEFSVITKSIFKYLF